MRPRLLKYLFVNSTVGNSETPALSKFTGLQRDRILSLQSNLKKIIPSSNIHSKINSSFENRIQTSEHICESILNAALIVHSNPDENSNKLPNTIIDECIPLIVEELRSNKLHLDILCKLLFAATLSHNASLIALSPLISSLLSSQLKSSRDSFDTQTEVSSLKLILQAGLACASLHDKNGSSSLLLSTPDLPEQLSLELARLGAGSDRNNMLICEHPRQVAALLLAMSSISSLGIKADQAERISERHETLLPFERLIGLPKALTAEVITTTSSGVKDRDNFAKELSSTLLRPSKERQTQKKKKKNNGDDPEAVSSNRLAAALRDVLEPSRERPRAALTVLCERLASDMLLVTTKKPQVRELGQSRKHPESPKLSVEEIVYLCSSIAHAPCSLYSTTANCVSEVLLAVSADIPQEAIVSAATCMLRVSGPRAPSTVKLLKGFTSKLSSLTSSQHFIDSGLETSNEGMFSSSCSPLKSLKSLAALVRMQIAANVIEETFLPIVTHCLVVHYPASEVENEFDCNDGLILVEYVIAVRDLIASLAAQFHGFDDVLSFEHSLHNELYNTNGETLITSYLSSDNLMNLSKEKGEVNGLSERMRRACAAIGKSLQRFDSSWEGSLRGIRQIIEKKYSVASSNEQNYKSSEDLDDDVENLIVIHCRDRLNWKLP